MKYEEIDARDRRTVDEVLREMVVVAGLDERDGATIIGVTSPGASEGKTTLSLALATVLSRDYGGDAVLVVDACLDSPGIATALGIQPGRGLSDVLRGDLFVEQAEHREAAKGLAVITAGSASLELGRAVRSDLLYEVFAQLRLRHRFVVIDLPAVLRSMATPVLARRCDAVLVVARHGRTTTGDIGRTLALLRDSPVSGVVLNGHRSAIPRVVRRAVGLAG